MVRGLGLRKVGSADRGHGGRRDAGQAPVPLGSGTPRGLDGSHGPFAPPPSVGPFLCSKHNSEAPGGEQPWLWRVLGTRANSDAWLPLDEEVLQREDVPLDVE